jgi:pyruvate/2-oxoglutarate dehydrogenase complex dihydrolipoamide dehydrogenase (E3) component
VHEAHVAVEVIAGELQGNKELAAATFNARVIPSVAYTDPEVAWVGLTRLLFDDSPEAHTGREHCYGRRSGSR